MNIWWKIPWPIKKVLYSSIYRTPYYKFLPLWYRKRIIRKTTDVYLISFPKCGRTWLRLMLGKSLVLHNDLDDFIPNDLLELDKLVLYDRRIPIIRAIHDPKPHNKRPEELQLLKEQYADSKIIFLIRDPRDVIVSLYFHMMKRSQAILDITLSSFLRSKSGSLDTLICWHNIWANYLTKVSNMLVVRYENLHLNTERELARIFDFIDLGKISEKHVKSAVEFSGFANMRKMEANNFFDSEILRTRDKSDPEAYKVRKGEIGGYREYLSDLDVEYINDQINNKFSHYYSFYKY